MLAARFGRCVSRRLAALPFGRRFSAASAAAAAAKGKKGKGKGKAAATVMANPLTDPITVDMSCVDIIKNAPPAEVKPDSEYPEWIFSLGQDDATLNKLTAQLSAQGFDSLSEFDKRKLFKLDRRKRIKDSNSSADKF